MKDMIRPLACNVTEMLLLKRNISTRENTIDFDSDRFELGVPRQRDHVLSLSYDGVSRTEPRA